MNEIRLARVILMGMGLVLSSCMEIEVKSLGSVANDNSNLTGGSGNDDTGGGDDTGDTGSTDLTSSLEVSDTQPFAEAATTATQSFGGVNHLVITTHPASLMSGTNKDLGCYNIGSSTTVVCTQKIVGLQAGYKVYGTGWLSTAKLSLSATNNLPEGNVDLGKMLKGLKNTSASTLDSTTFNTLLQNKWADIYPVISGGKIWTDLIYVWGDDTTGTLLTQPYFLVGSAVADPSTLANITPNDTYFGDQWALEGIATGSIMAKQAWRYETDCREKIIGVLDTGIDITHPDLAANIWTNPVGTSTFLHGKNFITETGDVDDDNGHGSHVSGIIAGVGNNAVGVTGVCWKARLMALKILDDTGSGVVSDFAEGIAYATANGVNVLNLSLGMTGDSTTIDTAVKGFLDGGGILVAAAGNGDDNGNPVNNDTTYFSPANYKHPTASLDNVISVASIDGTSVLSSFSNYGATTVDLAAPGGLLDPTDDQSDEIASTYENDGYEWLEGTSMATPYVTGAVALYWATRPTKTAAQVKAALLNSVTTKSALSGKVKTGGQLNLAQLLLQN